MISNEISFQFVGTATSIREILDQSEELLGVKDVLDGDQTKPKVSGDPEQANKGVAVPERQTQVNLIGMKKNIIVERTLNGMKIDPNVEKAKMVSDRRRQSRGFPTMEQFLREMG